MTIPWRTVLKIGIPVLVFIGLFGTNNPGLLLALGLVVAGSAVYLWRKDRAEMQSVLGELQPPERSSAAMRVVCLLAGHKWIPAAEAPGTPAVGAASVASYAGDGDDTVVLVCRRCGRKKGRRCRGLSPLHRRSERLRLPHRSLMAYAVSR